MRRSRAKGVLGGAGMPLPAESFAGFAASKNCMATDQAQRIIKTAVMEWPDVSVDPHRFGGIEFRFGKRELGHIHGNHLVDIPFPKVVRDEVLEKGLADKHHYLPEIRWISRYLWAPEDVTTAITLLRRSYDLAVAQRERYSGTATAA